jgi:hypothetical protein
VPTSVGAEWPERRLDRASAKVMPRGHVSTHRHIDSLAESDCIAALIDPVARTSTHSVGVPASDDARSQGQWDVFDVDVLAATLNTQRSANALAGYRETRRLVEVAAAGDRFPPGSESRSHLPRD